MIIDYTNDIDKASTNRKDATPPTPPPTNNNETGHQQFINLLAQYVRTIILQYDNTTGKFFFPHTHVNTAVPQAHRPTGPQAHRRERPRNGRVQNRKQATAEKKKVGDHNRGILLYYLPNTPRTHTVVYPPVTPTLRNSSLQTSTRSFLNRSNSWYKLAPDNLYFLSQIA